MPKYRSLSTEELQSMEQEFVEYLVVNGITADDWVKMKTEDQPAAEKIIDLFSDVVFESILRKTTFLEFRAKQQIISFQCLSEKIQLFGLKSESPLADFTDPVFVADMSNKKFNVETRIFTSEKPYSKNRESEIFEMLENGCAISEGKIFKTLALTYAEQKAGK